MNLDKIISRIHEYERLLLFIRDNPDVLVRWKNKNAGVDETPARDTTEATYPNGESRYGYTDR